MPVLAYGHCSYLYANVAVEAAPGDPGDSFFEVLLDLVVIRTLAGSPVVEVASRCFHVALQVCYLSSSGLLN